MKYVCTTRRAWWSLTTVAVRLTWIFMFHYDLTNWGKIGYRASFHEIDARSGAEAAERAKLVTLHSTHVTQGDTKQSQRDGRPQMASPIALIKAVTRRQQPLQGS